MSPPTTRTSGSARAATPGARADQRALEGDRVVDDADVGGHDRGRVGRGHDDDLGTRSAGRHR